MDNSKNPSIKKIILIHGFGFSPKVMDPLVQFLQGLQGFQGFLSIEARFGFTVESIDLLANSLEMIEAELAEKVDKETFLIGFSLGGLIALKFHEKAAGISLISSSPCFIAKKDWPGIQPTFFEKFEQLFHENPEKALKQFLLLQLPALQRPDAFLKSCVTSAIQDENLILWQKYLLLLKNSDLRGMSPVCPLQIILGKADALLPSSLSAALEKNWDLLNPKSKFYKKIKIQLIDNQGHYCLESKILQDYLKSFLLGIPHFYWTPAFAGATMDVKVRNSSLLESFLKIEPPGLELGLGLGLKKEKFKIGQCFSRAAKTYDKYAHVQKKVADSLLNYLDQHENLKKQQHKKLNAETMHILDLGSGTGYCLLALKKIFPKAKIFGIDISLEQCQVAQSKGIDTLICGDFDALPLASDSFDLVFSSLTLQWSPDLTQSLKEIFRILKPGGVLIFSTIGDQSLPELHEARKSDKANSAFLSKEKSMAALGYHNFDIFLSERRTEKFLYDSPIEVIRNIKAVGANYSSLYSSINSSGLSSKKSWALFADRYPQEIETQKYPLTYQIDYFGAQKSEKA
jgi:malonyl-CoA O-methyltransferase